MFPRDTHDCSIQQFYTATPLATRVKSLRLLTDDAISAGDRTHTRGTCLTIRMIYYCHYYSTFLKREICHIFILESQLYVVGCKRTFSLHFRESIRL